MAVQIFKRYEKKFLLDEMQFHELLPVIKEHMMPDMYCMDGSRYTIYNIYYDTNDKALIRSSLSKPYYKEKLRVRSYCIPQSPHDTVFLEIKKKVGGLGSKRRATLTLQEADQLIISGVLPEKEDYIQNQVLKEIGYFTTINKVKPSAYISYERIAFTGMECPELRVTFDTHILSRLYDLSLMKGCYGESLLTPGQILMEVKTPDVIPLWLTEKLSELKVYHTSFSKYGNVYTQSLSQKESSSIIPDKLIAV
jgi:hypothetical protein